MDWGEFGKNIIGKKMIVLLLVTGAVYFFLQYLTPLSAPVLLAMLFVTIFGPMMKRMNQRLHFPRPLSAIVILIVATVLLVGLLWILVSWMLGSLPVWIGNLELREQEWLEAVRGLCRSVGELLVWTLRIWKIRSVAGYRRGWIHWKKIFCRECFPSLCSMCSGSRSWEDFW
ncbi:MAG: AI-2E family transporter [Waltera sp.]